MFGPCAMSGMIESVRLYFDANALIQAVEGPGQNADGFAQMLQRASHIGLDAVTSELTLAELLVHPLRNQDLRLISAYNNLLSIGTGSQLETRPVSREILIAAARVRALHPSLKLPDAIHVATAEQTGCSHIISGDKRLAGTTALPVMDPDGADLAAFLEVLP